VHNLHGLPGVLGGIFGAISASLADSSFNNELLVETFPKLADGRTSSEQGWIQLMALGITLAIAISGGAISGFVASRFGKIEELFDDEEHFKSPGYIEVVDEDDRGQEMHQVRTETEANMNKEE